MSGIHAYTPRMKTQEATGFCFRAADYGPAVAEILSLAGDGHRPLPLVMTPCASEVARQRLLAAPARDLFPGARAPEAALAGLFAYFCCFEEAHTLVENREDPEGMYWHGIIHRSEPREENARYWFQQLGAHPIFPMVAQATGKTSWDPFAFMEQCNQARIEPGSELETRTMAAQTAEWQILFDYCSRPA